MTAFDTTLRVGEASLQPIEDENGNVYEAQLVLGTITLLPVGPGQAVPMPIGAYRVPLNRDAIKALYEQFGQALEVIKERPNIAIAGSMDGVEQAAQAQQGLR
jgi:hypothetical protein